MDPTSPASLIDLADKFATYPVLGLIIVILWLFDRIVGKLIDVIKLQGGLKEK